MRYATTLLAACILMLGLALPASAQTNFAAKDRATRAEARTLAREVLAELQQTMTWELRVYQVGVDPIVGTPFFTLPLPPAIVVCNTTQTYPTDIVPTPTNPRSLWWTQSDIGQICKADLSGQTGFVSLPTGGPYPFTLVATNEVGSSPIGVGENPFRVVLKPTTPGTVRLVK